MILSLFQKKKMGKFCSAINCSNESGTEKCVDTSFHRFPLKKKDLLKKWLQNMRQINSNLQNIHLFVADISQRTPMLNQLVRIQLFHHLPSFS